MVILGKFNPAIMSPEFLKDECGLGLEGGEYITPAEFPFPREITFNQKKLSFFIDLDRLQIKEDGADLSGVGRLAQCAKVYLGKLPYTPILSAGINFNFFTQLNEEEYSLLKSIMVNETNLFNVLGIDDFALQAEKHYVKEVEPIFRTWILTYHKDPELISSIRIIAKGANKFDVNHNLEVRNLLKNSKNIDLILDHFDEIKVYHETVTHILFGV